MFENSAGHGMCKVCNGGQVLSAGGATGYRYDDTYSQLIGENL
jgi:hypothetical protein